MSRFRRTVVVVALGSILLAACGSDGDPSSTAAPSTTAAPPATATSVPPTWSVDQVPPPDGFTAEYFQEVMEALDAAHGEVFRRFKAEGLLVPDIRASLGEIYAEPWLERVRQSWDRRAALQFNEVRDDPGDPDTAVQEITRASDDCVLLRTRRTLDALRDGPPVTEEQARKWIVLEPRPAEEYPSASNPTAWIISLDGPTTHGGPPEGACL